MFNRPIIGVTHNPLTDSPYDQQWNNGMSFIPPISGDFLLLSTGDYFLLSTGDKLELAG